jgi:ABC-type multidrug transport system ATPase subunit
MISLTSVTKRYGPLIAVNDVSCTIEKGEFFALLGPNGAGKTTTVKMLLDFVRPDSGTITIDGVSSAKAFARTGVGFCAENHRIPPHLTGLTYLRRIAELRGMKRGEADGVLENIIATVGMTGKETMQART